MTIKEVEQELGIPRATIRFYEKENLINPSRGENDYRHYSQEDVVRLKQIIVLRKIGISVSDIKALFDQKIPLSELVEKNISQLEEQIKELNGALRVSREMQTKHEELNSFDEEYYLQEINREEKAGSKFLDITNDILKFEKKVILEQFGLDDYNGNLRYGKLESLIWAIFYCLLMGIVFYFMYGRKIEKFIEGFTLPFMYVLINSIVGLPLHFLEKKHPKVAKAIRKAGWILFGMLILLAVYGFLFME